MPITKVDRRLGGGGDDNFAIHADYRGTRLAVSMKKDAVAVIWSGPVPPYGEHTAPADDFFLRIELAIDRKIELDGLTANKTLVITKGDVGG